MKSTGTFDPNQARYTPSIESRSIPAASLCGPKVVAARCRPPTK
jgi:hypothetical protein